MPYLGLRGARLSSAISAVCGLCFLCFGYAQGVLGGLLTVPIFLQRFPEIDTINNKSLHNAQIQGATVGTWNLGCFASALICIFLGDFLGRKKTLMLGLTLWVIGEIIQASSYSFGQFVAGRFIAGFGNGFTASTVPAYQAECVKSHRKGTILMISAGTFIALGLALSYWLTFALAYVSNPSTIAAAWRAPIAFQIIFALIAFAVLIFLPESPRWLILTGRENEALQVLSALNDEDVDGPEIRDEFLQIKDAILIMSQGSTSSLGSNKERRSLHRVVLAYFVQVFQQISGINLVIQYLSLMFLLQFGFDPWVSRLLGACAATEYFLASFITVVGIDRFWGRRSLMMFGSAGMAGCSVLLTIMLYFWQTHRTPGSNIAGTVFLFGFNSFFAIGWQGMAWLYQVEIVPLRIRGSANALSTSANWLFNFVIVFISPIAFRNIGWRTFIIFSATNAVIVPLVYFFYPETAYRSLEEVDVIFHLANEAPGNPWLNAVKISQYEPLWYGRKGDVPFDYERSDWHHRVQVWADGREGGTSGSGSERAMMGEKTGNLSDPTSSESSRRGVGGNALATEAGHAISSPENQSGSSPEPRSSHSPNEGSSSGEHQSFAAKNKKKRAEKGEKGSDLARTPPRKTQPPTGRYDKNDKDEPWLYPPGPKSRSLLPWIPGRPVYVARGESHESIHSARSAHSVHSDPEWRHSGLAPAPLRPSTSSRDRDLALHSSNEGGLDQPTTAASRDNSRPRGENRRSSRPTTSDSDVSPSQKEHRPRTSRSSRSNPRHRMEARKSSDTMPATYIPTRISRDDEYLSPSGSSTSGRLRARDAGKGG